MVIIQVGHNDQSLQSGVNEMLALSKNAVQFDLRGNIKEFDPNFLDDGTLIIYGHSHRINNQLYIKANYILNESSASESSLSQQIAEAFYVAGFDVTVKTLNYLSIEDVKTIEKTTLMLAEKKFYFYGDSINMITQLNTNEESLSDHKKNKWEKYNFKLIENISDVEKLFNELNFILNNQAIYCLKHITALSEACLAEHANVKNKNSFDNTPSYRKSA